MPLSQGEVARLKAQLERKKFYAQQRQKPSLDRKVSRLVESYLTLKYRKFCYEYLKCKDIGDAAVNSGFNRQMGTKLLRKTVIKLYLRHLMQKLEEQEIISAAWKQTKLKEIVEACTQLDIDTQMAKARQNEYSRIDPKSAIAAIAELNKMSGHYEAAKTETKHIFDSERLKSIVNENEENIFKKEY